MNGVRKKYGVDKCTFISQLPRLNKIPVHVKYHNNTPRPIYYMQIILHFDSEEWQEISEKNKADTYTGV